MNVRRAPAAGLSLLEALFALSLAMTVAGIAVPSFLEINRAVRFRSAASFAAGFLQRARMEAIARSATVGVRFREIQDDWLVGLYLDANGTGLRSADIVAGVDPPLEAEVAFGAHVPGVRVGRVTGVLDVNGEPGGDAVRFGNAGIASFSRDGSASSGTLYLTDGRSQIAVTVTAATGRVRVRQWDPQSREWRQIR